MKAFSAGASAFCLSLTSTLSMAAPVEITTPQEEPMESNQNSDRELEAISVYGTEASRYNADNSTTFGATLMDTPRSVQVIPEQVILDQHATELKDVLKNVSGISNQAGYGGTRDSFIARGFEIDRAHRDGFRSVGGGKANTSNIKEVEVIKGPAAVNFGRLEPGGVINVITKMPEATARNYIQTTFDDQGKKRALFDTTGPITSDNSLLYRLNLSYEDSETFRETDEPSKIERTNIAPSITWHPSVRSSLTFKYNHTDDNAPIDRGSVLALDPDGSGKVEIADIPNSRRLGEEYDFSDIIEDRYELLFNQDFGANMTLRNILTYAENQRNDYQTRPLLGIEDPTDLSTINSNYVFENGILIRRVDGNKDVDTKIFANELQLLSTVVTGPISHNITTGLSYRFEEEDFTSTRGLEQLDNGMYQLQLKLINIYDPVYSDEKQDMVDIGFSYKKNEERAIYAQDMLTLTPKLKGLIGVRYDDSKINTKKDTYLTTVANTGGTVYQENKTTTKIKGEREDNTSYSFGLTYQPIESLSVYTSYAESFEPNIVSNGDEYFKLDPEVSSQIEVGARTSLFNNTINFNIALYDIKKENVVTETFSDGTSPTLAGEQTSQGAEFDANIKVIPGLNVIATYAYTDAKLDKHSNPDNNGNRPVNVAVRTASLWGSYEFKTGGFRGLGFGLGAFHQGDRYGSVENDWEMDAYTTYDASAWYYVTLTSKHKLKVQSGVKNLTNEDYYVASNGDLRILVGEPRTTFVSLALNF